MPQHLHIDLESFSEVDINDVGAYRYAFDRTTEILCAAMALDAEEPRVWRQGMTDRELAPFEPYWDALENPETLIYAHNAQFEMAMGQALMQKTWGIACPDLSRFRCTMSMARRAALPAGLDLLAGALGLTEGKDKRGKALIRKFSQLNRDRKSKKNLDPQPYRIQPQDDPEDFAAFMDYCAQDVRIEQDVSWRLDYFDDPINNANYTLDARINARGVPVNLDALRHAQSLIEAETRIVESKFRALVGCNFTQDKQIKIWASANGYELPNMQAATIEAILEEWEDVEDADLEDDVIKALRMRAAVNYASIKKIPTMLACAGPHDNRIRGMLNYHGATTGRWTNSLVQFQNMKRPSLRMAKITEDAYKDICRGISLEMLRFLYGPPLEVISSCIRHFVHDVTAN